MNTVFSDVLCPETTEQQDFGMAKNLASTSSKALLASPFRGAAVTVTLIRWPTTPHTSERDDFATTFTRIYMPFFDFS
jgi:hypothetical protein